MNLKDKYIAAIQVHDDIHKQYMTTSVFSFEHQVIKKTMVRAWEACEVARLAYYASLNPPEASV